MASVEVVHPAGTDPMTLVNTAIELMDTRRRQAKKEEEVVPYDEVWVLKAFYPGYTKAQTPDGAMLEKIPTAVVHAERCRKHHEDSAGDGNPSTDADLFVRSLNEATRETNRFELPGKPSTPAS